jgi:purine-binding chemotaxis protein CheW
MTRQRSAATDGSEAASPSWLICRAGNVVCAIPIEYVIEIMRVLPIKTLAGAPHYICGLSIIRGAPVPVVDVGLVIGSGSGEPMRLVAVKAGTRVIALAVGEVVDISAVAAGRLAQLPPLLGDAAYETVRAIGTRDKELLVFLHSSRLVPDDILSRLDEAGAAA